jgi:hypothetical protein
MRERSSRLSRAVAVPPAGATRSNPRAASALPTELAVDDDRVGGRADDVHRRAELALVVAAHGVLAAGVEALLRRDEARGCGACDESSRETRRGADRARERAVERILQLRPTEVHARAGASHVHRADARLDGPAFVVHGEGRDGRRRARPRHTGRVRHAGRVEQIAIVEPAETERGTRDGRVGGRASGIEAIRERRVHPRHDRAVEGAERRRRSSRAHSSGTPCGARCRACPADASGRR